jgi:glycosyl transferase family 25
MVYKMEANDLSALDVDAVLCISLRNRNDRRESILKAFKNSGLNIEFYIVDKDEEDPQRGCWNSHQSCARLALERHYKRTLILEDDCILESFSTKIIERINRFLKEKNPQIFYLGSTLGKIWLTWRRNIARCRVKGTYAYILSEEGCKKLVGFCDYTGVGIDNLFSKRFKGYCVFPMICFHDSKFSSDIREFLDKIVAGRQICQPPPPQHPVDDRKKQYFVALKNLPKTLFRVNF